MIWVSIKARWKAIKMSSGAATGAGESPGEAISLNNIGLGLFRPGGIPEGSRCLHGRTGNQPVVGQPAECGHQPEQYCLGLCEPGRSSARTRVYQEALEIVRAVKDQRGCAHAQQYRRNLCGSWRLPQSCRDPHRSASSPPRSGRRRWGGELAQQPRQLYAKLGEREKGPRSFRTRAGDSQDLRKPLHAGPRLCVIWAHSTVKLENHGRAWAFWMRQLRSADDTRSKRRSSRAGGTGAIGARPRQSRGSSPAGRGGTGRAGIGSAGGREPKPSGVLVCFCARRPGTEYRSPDALACGTA